MIWGILTGYIHFVSWSFFRSVWSPLGHDIYCWVGWAVLAKLGTLRDHKEAGICRMLWFLPSALRAKCR